MKYRVMTGKISRDGVIYRPGDVIDLPVGMAELMPVGRVAEIIPGREPSPKKEEKLDLPENTPEGTATRGRRKREE